MGSAQVSASELCNVSDTTQILFIEEGEQNRSIVLEPGETIKNLCRIGCKLKSEFSRVLDLRGDEKVHVGHKGALNIVE